MVTKNNEPKHSMVRLYEVIGVALWKHEYTNKDEAIGCVHEMGKIVRENPAKLSSIRVKLHYTNDASIQFEFPDEHIVVDLIEEFSSRSF